MGWRSPSTLPPSADTLAKHELCPSPTMAGGQEKIYGQVKPMRGTDSPEQLRWGKEEPSPPSLLGGLVVVLGAKKKE